MELLASTGATVVLFAGPDWGATPVLGQVRGRVAIFNENLHIIAARHDAVIADLWALRQLTRLSCGTLTGCISPRWASTPSP